jgi:hypothetical protein
MPMSQGEHRQQTIAKPYYVGGQVRQIVYVSASLFLYLGVWKEG